MTAALWSWDDLVRAARAEADGRPAAAVTGFTNDSRAVQPGDVFVALKDVRDGHEFVASAFARGATAALVSRDYIRQVGDGALLRVDDTLRGLEDIGRAARARLAPDARVVAVTGSAGKTTTKEMLRAALARLGSTHAADKSFNNHIGVPLTLARMPADSHFAVLEIGMNHAGEIEPLSRMARPHVTIVTTVAPVHLEHFADEEAIADAKAEIFVGAEPGAAAILNCDNRHFARLAAAAEAHGARVLPFGSTPDCAARVTAHGGVPSSPLAAQAVSVALAGNGEPRTFDLAIAGRHMADNAAAVLLAVREVAGEAGIGAAIAGLSALQPGAGRGERTRLALPGGDALLIDEAYNANPLSMAAAIATAAEARDRNTARATESRLVAVLGDMLELGPDAARFHVGLAEALDVAAVDLVSASGPNMRHLYDALSEGRRGAWGALSADIEEGLLAAVRPGDVVMVKGSNGSRMARLVDALKSKYRA